MQMNCQYGALIRTMTFFPYHSGTVSHAIAQNCATGFTRCKMKVEMRCLSKQKRAGGRGECGRQLILGNDESYLLLYLDDIKRCEELPRQFLWHSMQAPQR